MAAWILFDALLIGILLLIIPIGFWRGGVPEALVSGSILAGVALANAFAERWGTLTSDVVGVRASLAQLVIAQALLWGTVIVLGYGGGAIPRSHGWSLLSRVSGAILSFLNGLLLLSFSLSFIDRFSVPAESRSGIENGYLAGLLVEGTDAILLIAVLLVSAGVFAGLIIRLAGGWQPEADLPAVESGVAHVWPAAPPTPRPHGPRRGADQDKFEPGSRGYDLADYAPTTVGWPQGGFSPGMDESGPRPREAADRAVPMGVELYKRRPVHPSQGAEKDTTSPSLEPADGMRVVEEWLRRATPSPKAERKAGTENEAADGPGDGGDPRS
ncbi:MAG TPA: CvpA family protein [Thermomicrobiales bacterium]|nr:CvpA family protein [Thermomicrobiales bacterium]